MIWENGIEICIIYMKRVASPGSMHDTGCLGLVHWDDPEGWYGREEGGGFRMENTCPEKPPSSRGEGLLFLPFLESNPESSLQTED